MYDRKKRRRGSSGIEEHVEPSAADVAAALR